jgi:CRP/FNR family cyclic AMP-dependent transcriptional regulator
MPFLDYLDPDERGLLLGALRRRDVAAGDTVFHAGSEGAGFAIVLAGRLKVITRSSNGRRILIGLRGPGDVVGEMAILDDAPRSADVVAVEAARVAAGSADAMRRHMLVRTATLVALSRSLAQRLREADAKRVEMAALVGSARVAFELLDLGRRYGQTRPDGVHIDLPLSQEELADLVGLSRPTVARALADLRAEGHVLTGRRRLTIIDPAGLHARAAS